MKNAKQNEIPMGSWSDIAVIFFPKLTQSAVAGSMGIAVKKGFRPTALAILAVIRTIAIATGYDMHANSLLEAPSFRAGRPSHKKDKAFVALFHPNEVSELIEDWRKSK